MPSKPVSTDVIDAIAMSTATLVLNSLKPELLRPVAYPAARTAVSGDEKPPAPKSWTIDGWCDKEDISRSTYCKLRNLGRGPRETRFGASVRITPAADAEWHAAEAAAASTEPVPSE